MTDQIITEADRAILDELEMHVRRAYAATCRPLPGEDVGDLTIVYAEVRLERANARFAAHDRIGRANDWHREQIAEAEADVARSRYTRGKLGRGRAEMNDHDMRAWRAEMGFSQREAAAKLGVSISAMQKYELPYTRRNAIPQPVALACAAIKAGLRPYSAPSALKPAEEIAEGGRHLRHAETDAEAAARKARAAARSRPKRYRASPEEVARQSALAREMRAAGKTFQQIADALGVPVSRASNLANRPVAGESDG